MSGIAAQLARPNILKLQPYRCARDDYSQGILLDANENAMGPPVPQEPGLTLERYPDPHQVPLKEKYAAYRNQQNKSNLRAENLFVGVGSDEAIDLLMRIFCVPGQDQILTTPPTYGMYKVSAVVNDAEIVNVPLTEDFDLQVEQIIEKASAPTVKLVFLCSPGNPTCKALPIADIQKVATGCADSAIVVVDEAYVDFSRQHASAVSILDQHANVVVLQTLSKAFGLAAIRCGFCLGPPDVIQLMNNVKAPYNVNELTSRQALAAMEHVDTKLSANVEGLLEQRTVVADALASRDYVVKVFPSDSNFLLVRFKEKALELYKGMADGRHKVVTRYRGSELHCTECLRITIGTAAENVACLKALDETHAGLT